MFRLFAFTLAALAVTAFATHTYAADEAKDARGSVVSVGSGKIKIKNKTEEKEYDLANPVKVTVKGKEGKIEDVKAKDRVKLTLADGKVSAVEVQEPKPAK